MHFVGETEIHYVDSHGVRHSYHDPYKLVSAWKSLEHAAGDAVDRAGWRTDKVTGLPTDAWAQFPRDLCLIQSELSEAFEGYRCDAMDKHLPHRREIEVEFADAILRIADTCRALGLDVGGALAEKLAYNETRHDHSLAARVAPGGKKF